jgi:hypothetical protein
LDNDSAVEKKTFTLTRASLLNGRDAKIAPGFSNPRCQWNNDKPTILHQENRDDGIAACAACQLVGGFTGTATAAAPADSRYQ